MEGHHLDGDPWNNEGCNLLPLCTSHHKLVHSGAINLSDPKMPEFYVDGSGKRRYLREPWVAELCFVYQPWCRHHRTRIDLASDPCPSVMANGLGGLSIHQYWLEGAGDMSRAAREPATLRFKYRSWGGEWGRERVDLASDPCPSVMANGLGGLSIHQYWLEGAGDMPRAAREPATLRFKYRSWGGKGGRERVDLEAEPCPVIMSDSVGGIEIKKVWLEGAGDMAVVDPETGALVPARQVAAQESEGHPDRRGALPDDHGAGVCGMPHGWYRLEGAGEHPGHPEHPVAEDTDGPGAEPPGERGRAQGGRVPPVSTGGGR